MWATIQKYKKTRRPPFKHRLLANKIQAEEDEIEIGIINNEINHFESTTKLFSSS